MVTMPKPKPPRTCVQCQQQIPDSLDAHVGPCGDTGKPHVLWIADSHGVSKEMAK